MQFLLKFHCWLIKILRKENVTDRQTQQRTPAHAQTTCKQYTIPKHSLHDGVGGKNAGLNDENNKTIAW